MKIFSILGLLIALYPCSFGGEIKNGRVPAGKNQSLVFTEELRLGPQSGNENHVWVGSKVNLQINNQGHMFVLDEGGNRILQFAPDGELVRQIGKEGEGPEEFRSLRMLTILDDQSMVVHENRQGTSVFTYYDKDMNWQDRKTFPPGSFDKVLSFAGHDPDGAKVRGLYIHLLDQANSVIKTGLLSGDFKDELIPLSQHKLDRFDGQRALEPGYFAQFISQYFSLSGMGLVAFGSDGVIYTATTDKYQITRWSADMKQKIVFSRDYKPAVLKDDEVLAMIEPLRQEVMSGFGPQAEQFITEKVIRKAVELAAFPPAKQPLFGLVPMEKGRLLAVHQYSAQTGKSRGDLFDEKGNFIGETDLPKVAVSYFGSYFGTGAKLWFKNGKAYALEDNDGDVSLVRYAYTWK